jgi:hypothetical protein
MNIMPAGEQERWQATEGNLPGQRTLRTNKESLQGQPRLEFPGHFRRVFKFNFFDQSSVVAGLVGYTRPNTKNSRINPRDGGFRFPN